MLERGRQLVLRVLRVPATPQPPLGASGSVVVFRAGKNYYKLRLAAWAAKQLFTLLGIVFSVGLLLRLEYDIREVATLPPPQRTIDRNAVLPAQPESADKRLHAAQNKHRQVEREIARFASQAPWWVLPLITGLKLLGIALYLVQIPITLIAVRLEYEQRWYIVTDRSLRIREGIWRVQELTMSFANLQHVVVTQGPLQRLLSLGDVRVQSAGGGGGHKANNENLASLHSGVFHGVDNATEIRDLIIERVQQFRAAGLGDPDDHDVHRTEPESSDSRDARVDSGTAAREVLAAARALRADWKQLRERTR